MILPVSSYIECCSNVRHASACRRDGQHSSMILPVSSYIECCPNVRHASACRRDRQHSSMILPVSSYIECCSNVRHASACRREGQHSSMILPVSSYIECCSSHTIRAAILFAALTVSATAYAQTKLLRFPDIQGDRVAFTYGGDIWSAPASGGTAIRLTAHPGVEVFAKFSPDGKWIAFTGQYDGDEQVYVISAAGGEPKQLTFYPAKGP